MICIEGTSYPILDTAQVNWLAYSNTGEDWGISRCLPGISTLFLHLDHSFKTESNYHAGRIQLTQGLPFQPCPFSHTKALQYFSPQVPYSVLHQKQRCWKGSHHWESPIITWIKSFCRLNMALGSWVWYSFFTAFTMLHIDYPLVIHATAQKDSLLSPCCSWEVEAKILVTSHSFIWCLKTLAADSAQSAPLEAILGALPQEVAGFPIHMMMHCYLWSR